MNLLHYEVAVLSFEIVKDYRYFSYAWFDFEFQVARFVCWTSVLTCKMTVISYFGLFLKLPSSFLHIQQCEAFSLAMLSCSFIVNGFG